MANDTQKFPGDYPHPEVIMSDCTSDIWYGAFR